MKINFQKRILTDAEYDEATGNHLRKDLPPGTAMWMNIRPDHIGSLLFTCPCGCGVVRTVPVALRPATAAGETMPPRPAWDWDGNLEAPTLVPSIQVTEGCRWHGYLTDGDWKQC